MSQFSHFPPGECPPAIRTLDAPSTRSCSLLQMASVHLQLPRHPRSSARRPRPIHANSYPRQTKFQNHDSPPVQLLLDPQV